jgi:hypothetical protein
VVTSKTIVLRFLDGVIVAFVGILALSLAGVPMAWLSGLIDMSPREFRAFSIFVVSASLWLMHAIATSDSAP